MRQQKVNKFMVPTGVGLNCKFPDQLNLEKQWRSQESGWVRVLPAAGTSFWTISFAPLLRFTHTEVRETPRSRREKPKIGWVRLKHSEALKELFLRESTKDTELNTPNNNRDYTVVWKQATCIFLKCNHGFAAYFSSSLPGWGEFTHLTASLCKFFLEKCSISFPSYSSKIGFRIGSGILK